MRNGVPIAAVDDPPVAPVADEVAARTLRDRAVAYAEEVGRLVDAAYVVMRRDDTLDPRVSDIVAESGLSNQAFYRHFRGKDELLLAVLEDGQRRLVSYLDARMSRVDAGPERVRAWIEGVLEQARNRDAAENTRPFASNAVRLAERFPDGSSRSRERLMVPLRAAVAVAGGDPDGDAEAIYQLAMGRMQDALLRRDQPSRQEVDHLVDFALRGIGVE